MGWMLTAVRKPGSVPEGKGHMRERVSAPRPASRFAQARPSTFSPAVQAGLRSPSRPLEPPVRAAMEARFAHDFSRVRLHDGPEAAESARAAGAFAYTVGTDVVFARGQLAPHTDWGRRLLAHELTHVVQQSESRASGVQLRGPFSFDDPLEE